MTIVKILTIAVEMLLFVKNSTFFIRNIYDMFLIVYFIKFEIVVDTLQSNMLESWRRSGHAPCYQTVEASTLNLHFLIPSPKIISILLILLNH
jgi:hypothetical protein